MAKSLTSLATSEPWTVAGARAVLTAAKRSGLSIPAFAKHHGFDPQRLYWWRRRLDRATPVESPGFEEIRPAVTAFVRSGSVQSGDEHVEIVLRSGRILRVGRSFDEDVLRRVLAVVDDETRAC
jgi:hypothetical protein